MYMYIYIICRSPHNLTRYSSSSKLLLLTITTTTIANFNTELTEPAKQIKTTFPMTTRYSSSSNSKK